MHILGIAFIQRSGAAGPALRLVGSLLPLLVLLAVVAARVAVRGVVALALLLLLLFLLLRAGRPGAPEKGRQTNFEITKTLFARNNTDLRRKC